jgi:hypothetical protein
METPIRDWIEGLDPADRERIVHLNEWAVLGALAVALGPVGTERDGARLRGAFLQALVAGLRTATGSAGVRRAIWEALEVAAAAALQRAFDACDDEEEPWPRRSGNGRRG